jgi:peptide/nickel transport system ATP-binding protein
MATLFVTHDLKLATEYADRVLVMHAGHLVESAPVSALWSAPAHPYTARLLKATVGGDIDRCAGIGAGQSA